MKKHILLFVFTLTMSLLQANNENNVNASTPQAEDEVESTRLAELDAYWTEMSRTVKEGDFKGMVALYHKDGVLVSETKSVPIASALKRWKPGIEDTKLGKNESNVDFRFSNRKGDATTALETGIFHYTSVDENGKELADVYIHFEELVVKIKGEWVALMENQKTKATKAEWDALK